jgi:BirA family transcriptional regulator, biotin operon repressor / biotin---[acetyl-CoA-carboxylase] ligase
VQFTVQRFESVDSTNTVAADLARNGAAEGHCVVADQQTAGRGRHGRTWTSQSGAGLYLSIVLRPGLPLDQLPLITLMAGVAAHDALRDTGLKPDIKWVNDVLIDERKICGILAETVETPSGMAVILGVGVNLTDRNIPEELRSTATTLEAHGVSDANIEAVLLDRLAEWYEVLSGFRGPYRILDAWQQRSTYYSGKKVRITLHEDVITGTTDGLEPNGALRVKANDGSVTVVHAGDVERLRSAEAGAN